VPTLLFRNESERQEGLGKNILLSKFDKTIINDFIANPEQYRMKPADINAQPSAKIISTINEMQIVG
jgi:UDP-N-acetylglucosamine 2-epimerase (non-hydrolysing)